jgi:hypothetical protein
VGHAGHAGPGGTGFEFGGVGHDAGRGDERRVFLGVVPGFEGDDGRAARAKISLVSRFRCWWWSDWKARATAAVPSSSSPVPRAAS